MVKRHTLPKDQARRLIERCFADLREDADPGFVPVTALPEIEFADQRDISLSRIQSFTEQIDSRSYDAEVRSRALLLAGQAGLSFESLGAGSQLDLMEGVARASIEQAHLHLFRLQDRLASYEPVDALFRGLLLPASITHPIEAERQSPTLQRLHDIYLDYGSTHWVPKTLASRSRQLRLLLDFIGPDTPAAEITPPRVRDFRDALMSLRARGGADGATDFSERQTNEPASQISAKTALLIFETAKCLFRWAHQEAHIAADPSRDLQVKLPPTKAKGKRVRRPFSSDQLTAIFSSPVFQGCASVARRTEAGALRVFDGKFWVPIIAHYTGLRLSEIIQLQLEDIITVDGIPCFNVTEEGGGAPGSGEHKHVKSHAGVRLVPLHPDLVTLGFIRFVHSRRKRAKGKGRVFPEIAYGADGMPSTVFSKWFARFLTKVGIDEPEYVFHSFRHNAQDALKDAKVPVYLIDKVFGHADKATASYGEGNSIVACAQAIAEMKFKVDVLRLVEPMP